MRAERNWFTRFPCEPLISTPSKPASRSRRAAPTNEAIASSMSASVISRGTSRLIISRTGEGARGRAPMSEGWQ
ncbi:MAG: hypothetical protein NTU62_08275 [Spirochaetes bacterium]|nr:hypothetical protein [Spirochaetota bacterium]